MVGKLGRLDSNKIHNYTGFTQSERTSVKQNKDPTCAPGLDEQN